MVMPTRKVEHALFILLDLALQPNQRKTTTKEIVERWRLPPALTPVLVSKLAAHGWIASERGYYGGIYLAVPPRRISVGEVVEVIEGSVALVDCLFGSDRCPTARTCVVRDVWYRAQEAIEEVLWATTLADLIRAKRDMDRELRAGRRTRPRRERSDPRGLRPERTPPGLKPQRGDLRGKNPGIGIRAIRRRAREPVGDDL